MNVLAEQHPNNIKINLNPYKILKYKYNYGGGGGSRTRVRKYSAQASTYIS